MAKERKLTIKAEGKEHYEGFTITKHERPNGSVYYDVYLGRALGRKRPRFDTLGAARGFAQLKSNELTDHGIKGQKLSEKQKTDAAAAFERTMKLGATLEAVLDFYEKHHQRIDENNGLGSLIDKYWAVKEKQVEQGEFRIRSYNECIKCLKDFKLDLGHLAVDAVTPKEIDSWLDQNRPKPTSRANHKVYIKAFFNWAISEEKLEINPVKKTRKVKRSKHIVSIYTPAEVEAVMMAAIKFGAEHKDTRMDKNGKPIAPEQSAIIPYLALGFFAGIRPNELHKRLRWKDFNFELGEIHVNAETSKTSSARIVHIEPNLAEYLIPCRKEDNEFIFPYSDSTLKRWRTKVFSNAQVETIQDGSRHSYGTYHLAKYESVDKTMREMGHKLPQTLHDFYVGLAENRDKQAEKYFNITPNKGKIIPMVKAG
ncbi:tyrosine-type recombinase/integrase [Pontiella sulfatireligans]|uniref:Core-binding (CB) domain-containing protein n=1 Tax=Pontiella sulfatireligans TaxID=2750658 RepID=A0A6C2UPU6_9BACT|nr:site-specific integrase [Pontiella sulfatireligans]VGO22320.1 hypothetical protein SCARR_04403 [Pontiella sulfatireligans]